MNYNSFSKHREREAELILATSVHRDEANLLDSSFDGLRLKICTKDLAFAILAWYNARAGVIEKTGVEKAWASKTFLETFDFSTVEEYFTCTSDGIKLPVALILFSGCALNSGVGIAKGNNAWHRMHFTLKALKRWLLAFADGDSRACVKSLLTVTDERPIGRTGENRYSTQTYLETVISSFAARSSQHDRWTTLLACITCVAYGGIHAVGWDFLFVSRIEQLLWRISCPLLIILGVPMYSFISEVEEDEDQGLLVKLKHI